LTGATLVRLCDVRQILYVVERRMGMNKYGGWSLAILLIVIYFFGRNPLSQAPIASEAVCQASRNDTNIYGVYDVQHHR
jgi:hypothetical protein